MKNVRGLAVVGLLGALAVTGWSQTPDRCDRRGYDRSAYRQYQAPYQQVSDREFDRSHYRRDSGYGYSNRPNGRYDNRGAYGRYDNGYYHNGTYNNGYYNGGYNNDGYYYERPGSHSAAIIGGGAAAGAGIGAAVGGTKGAIIGAAAGGAAGLIYDRKTRYNTRW